MAAGLQTSLGQQNLAKISIERWIAVTYSVKDEIAFDQRLSVSKSAGTRQSHFSISVMANSTNAQLLAEAQAARKASPRRAEEIYKRILEPPRSGATNSPCLHPILTAFL